MLRAPPGFRRATAGVILLELRPATLRQHELDLNPGGSAQQRLSMVAVNGINDRYGRRTVSMAGAGLAEDRRSWTTKHERRTPAYTTCPAEMAKARARWAGKARPGRRTSATAQPNGEWRRMPAVCRRANAAHSAVRRGSPTGSRDKAARCAARPPGTSRERPNHVHWSWTHKEHVARRIGWRSQAWVHHRDAATLVN